MARQTADSVENFSTGENFADLFNEVFSDGPLEGSVLQGTVIALENDAAVIDVGLKSAGRVALKEFALPGQKAELKVGDTVEVYLERYEDRNGETMLSREKAA
jgi:Ribosomal protein S1